MNRQTLQGIVLKTIPFKERGTIVALFTPEYGLFKLFCRGSKRQSQAERALLSTLTEGEFHYAPGKQELARFYGGDIICQYLTLRKDYTQLDTALRLGQAILDSQWQGKEASKLYILFTYFLKQLNHVKDPNTLYTTFLLKTMVHEGNFHLPNDENVKGLTFEQEEEKLIKLLIHNRSFEGLKELELPGSFHQKIETLFNRWVNC